jgi:hypothetical protein
LWHKIKSAGCDTKSAPHQKSRGCGTKSVQNQPFIKNQRIVARVDIEFRRECVVFVPFLVSPFLQYALKATVVMVVVVVVGIEYLAQ